jgi:hypothetical protein
MLSAPQNQLLLLALALRPIPSPLQPTHAFAVTAEAPSP